MHRGTNIVTDNDLFLFLWVWVWCCAFLIGDRNMLSSQGLVGFWFGFKIGTAIIPRYRNFVLQIFEKLFCFGSTCDPFLGILG